jgi:hypothetical protein
VGLKSLGWVASKILAPEISRQQPQHAFCTAAASMGKLNFQDPVPADIEIAQSVTPTPITEIAKQLNISPSDFESHGTTKAKVLKYIHLINCCLLLGAS